MVDRLQAFKLTLGLPRQVSQMGQAKAGWWKQGVNTPTPIPPTIPDRRPAGSQPRLGPQPWHQQARKQCPAAGFTLVELLIVVVIIGVLSGVAMPAFLGQQNKARINAANLKARGLMSYCLAHFIDNGKMPNTGDAEYDRLSKDPKYGIIKWNAQRADDECKVNIEGNNLDLKQKGIFSIKASGDATTIQATPAKA